MNHVGIIKKIDSMGRIIVPKTLRNRYLLDKRIEMVATEEGILIRNPEYKIVKEENDTIRSEYRIKNDRRL